ncbi:MAG: transferase [Gallionellaceae bacterium]
MKSAIRAGQEKIEQLLAWTAIPASKVESGKPYLTEVDGILALQFDTLSVQSEMNIDMPDELVIAYTRAMMSFLLLEPTPRYIAMIGLGGGSLAKYCYRYLPQTAITVIEINPEVIALRNEFAIPADDARFDVLLGDGAQWVTETNKQPDVLMVDGFDTSGLPAQLSSQRFYDDCFAALAENGIMVVNLWGGYPQYPEYLARIRTSFADNTVIIEADGGVNNIIFAVKGVEFPPPSSTIRHHAKLLGLSHPVNFQAKSNKMIKALPIRAA